MNQSSRYTICRLCLCNGSYLLDVFEEENGAVFDVKQVIEELLQLEVVNKAMYPWMVCSVCLGRLTEFNCFKRRCKENQVVYDKRIINVKGEVKRGNVGAKVAFRLEEDKVPNETPFEVSCWNYAPAERYESQEVLNGSRVEVSAKPEVDKEVPGNEIQTDMSAYEQLDIGKTEIFSGEDTCQNTADVRLPSLSLPSEGKTSVQREEPSDIIHIVKVEPTNEDVYGDSSVIQKDQMSDQDSSVEYVDEELNTVSKTETSSNMEMNDPTRRGSSCSMADDSCHSPTYQGTLRERFVCDECGYSCVSKTSLLNHITGHERGKSKDKGRGQGQKNGDGLPFINCSAVFKSCEHLYDHLPKEHPEFICNYCRKAYSEMVQLINHIKSVHFKIQGHTYQPGLTSRYDEKRRKLFQCDDCGKVFHLKQSLMRHVISVHLGLKPFSCQVCSKAFSRKSHRNFHVQTVHIGERRFECEDCKKAFKDKEVLKNHMLTHLEKHPFPCSLCQKSFVCSNELKYHMESHSRVMHSCDVCGKVFKQVAQLRKHLRCHSVDRPYKCTQCPKAFKTNSHLSYHSILHSELRKHSCKVCGKKFSYSGHLSVHMRTHDGKRAYVCSVCSKAFKVNGHLKRHLKTHDENREMFECEVCGKSMTSKGQLKRHLKKLHGKDMCEIMRK